MASTKLPFFCKDSKTNLIKIKRLPVIDAVSSKLTNPPWILGTAACFPYPSLLISLA